MNSSKVIHLITTIERGGAEKQLLTLASQQIKLGLTVVVFYLKGEPELKIEFENLGVVVKQDLVNKGFISQILIFKKYCKSNSLLVHAHLPKSELLAAICCKAGTYIFTRHNSEPFWPRSPKFISNRFSRFVERRAAHGICISHAVKNYLIQRGEIHDETKLTTIYYGFEKYVSSGTFESIFSRKSLGISEGEFIVGCIGRLVKQKDYPTLLRAIRQLIDSNLRIKLLIIGEGKEKAKLIKLTKSLGINDKVHFLGRTKFIYDFLSVIDVFVLPSIYEGFGLVLLEVMQASKPIIAARNSSIPEVMGSDYPGLFATNNHINLSTLLKQLIINDSMAKNLVLRYPARLQFFRPEIMALNVFQIYEKYGHL